MQKISCYIAAAVLSMAGSTAFAEPLKEDTGPVAMTDAQMDTVAAGALINVVAVDVVDVQNNEVAVQIPVAAAVAANVLCSECDSTSFAGAPGRIAQ